MSRPRIFYFCYDHNRPTGGQKHTYRHVDILNSHGFVAYAVHKRPRFRLTWFHNQTRTIDYGRFVGMVDPATDLVVVPEDMGYAINSLPCRKIVFNKNIYHGFKCYPVDAVEACAYPYTAAEVIGAFVVSEHNRQILQCAYPHLHIERAYLDINPAIFRLRDLSSKKPQIVFCTKNAGHFLSIYHILRARSLDGLNAAKSFSFRFLHNEHEDAVAAMLNESLALVFLSLEEGMGRLPLEAMACGALVVAYGEGPLQEVIPPQLQFRSGDLLGIVRYLEDVIASYPHQLSQWNGTVTQCASIAAEYSPSRQEVELIRSWNRLLHLD